MSIKVEIGSGEYPKEGYIHMDIRPGLPCQEVQAGITQLPFRDESLDEILAVMVIEHITLTKAGEAMSECRRTLKVGGVLAIYTMDLVQLCAWVLNGEKDIDVVVGWMYARSRYPENIHRWAYTPDRLRRLFRSHGFSIVEEETVTDNGLYLVGRKL